MKTKVLFSVAVLSAVMSTAFLNADNAVETGEEPDVTEAMPGIDAKKLVKSASDVVKKAAKSVKKAVPIGASTEPQMGDDEANGEVDTNTPKQVMEKKAEVEDDSKDAEANRKVSDTSIAIYSQNPYIQSVMENTTHIKAARLKELMARGDKVTMLDVRPRSEFAKTPGIKGVTLNIPRNFLEVEAYEKLPNKDASIIIISTKGIRGGLAANTLQQMGYTNVRNLMDGLEGWNKTK